MCLGLGIGTSAAKNAPPIAGVFGLLAGPIGFVVARALHQGVAQALGVALGGMGCSLVVYSAKALQAREPAQA